MDLFPCPQKVTNPPRPPRGRERSRRQRRGAPSARSASTRASTGSRPASRPATTRSSPSQAKSPSCSRCRRDASLRMSFRRGLAAEVITRALLHRIAGAALRGAGASGLERGLRLGCDRGERRRVADGDVRKDLAVELDVRLATAGHKLVVRQPLAPRGGVDADDPEPAEDPLARLAVAVGVDVRLRNLLLRHAVRDRALADVAPGLLEHLAAPLARVDGSLDAGHSSPPPSYRPSRRLTSRASEPSRA